MNVSTAGTDHLLGVSVFDKSTDMEQTTSYSAHAANSIQSVRIFKSDLLERFTHVHPVVPALVWGPVFLFFVIHSVWIWKTGLSALALMAVCGVLTWTFMEYVLHRYVFHFSGKSKASERLVYLFHGIHHDTPNDKSRLVMPPVVSVSLGLVVFTLVRLVLPASMAEPFFAFIILGYLVYDYTHYYVHHARNYGLVGRFLKQHHMSHHFKTPHLRFGVSSPLWDVIFRTHR